MTSARRPLVLAAFVALLGGVAAWLALSPLGLLEESAGPLDGLLPPDVDAAVRFDPSTVAWSPLAERLWDHSAVRDARAAVGLDDHVLAPLRELEDRVGSATLGLAPRLERDVLGQEAIVAVRDEHVLLLSRLTTRGRLVDAAARLDVDDLRDAGLRVRGDTAVLEREDAPAVHLRRVRDVLVVSTSPDMLAMATALAEPPEGVPRGGSRYAAALERGTAPGDRVLLWMDPAALARGGFVAPEEGVAGLLASLLPPAGLDVAHGVMHLDEPDVLRVEIAGGWAGEPPAGLDALAADVPGGAGGLLAAAARFAMPEEAIATLGLAVDAENVVRTLADAQPPARRDLLDELLAERGVTIDDVARRIAGHLEDGIAGVTSRLPEADALELDDARNGGVHAIPATLVVFRLRRPESPDAVIATIAAEAESLFGSRLALEHEEGPGGARVHRLAEHRFGGEWALLRPAFAVVDGLLVFCTHDAHLVRSLEQRARGEPREASVEGARTLALRVHGGPLRRYVDDQRWAWADRATWRDWRAERAEILAELEREGSVLASRDRQVYVDRRIEMRLAKRNAEEFPAAIERYRAAWRPLGVLRSLTLSGARADARFRLEAEIHLSETDEP